MDLSSLTEADVGKLRVVKLKAILADAGVDNKAKKAEHEQTEAVRWAKSKIEKITLFTIS